LRGDSVGVEQLFIQNTKNGDLEESMENRQLELDLGDKLQKWELIARKMLATVKHSNNTSVRIFKGRRPEDWILGTRTFIYDTDYTYDHVIDWETAKYLYEKVGVWDFLDSVKGKLDEEKKMRLLDQVVICKKCGCEKTIAEMQSQDHKACFEG
jgi:hypothetical protein